MVKYRITSDGLVGAYLEKNSFITKYIYYC